MQVNKPPVIELDTTSRSLKQEVPPSARLKAQKPASETTMKQRINGVTLRIK
jgi:hypothetical protein